MSCFEVEQWRGVLTFDGEDPVQLLLGPGMHSQVVDRHLDDLLPSCLLHLQHVLPQLLLGGGVGLLLLLLLLPSPMLSLVLLMFERSTGVMGCLVLCEDVAGGGVRLTELT